MGFTRKSYNGLSRYVSERPIDTRVYMYIDTISKTDPICEIYLLKIPSKIHKIFTKPIEELRELIIKFKNSRTEADDFYDFKNEPHRMTFVFETNDSSSNSTSPREDVTK